MHIKANVHYRTSDQTWRFRQGLQVPSNSSNVERYALALDENLMLVSDTIVSSEDIYMLLTYTQTKEHEVYDTNLYLPVDYDRSVIQVLKLNKPTQFVQQLINAHIKTAQALYRQEE